MLPERPKSVLQEYEKIETQKKGILQSNAGGPIALVLLGIAAYALYAHYSNPHVNFDVRINVSGTAKKVALGYGSVKQGSAEGVQNLQTVGEGVPVSKSFPVESRDIVAIVAQNYDDQGTLKLSIEVKVEGDENWQPLAERECSGKGCKIKWGGMMPERKLY